MFNWFNKDRTYYSIDEVSKHNNENDLWIIINKKVYDVTNYIDNHPGGKKMFSKIGGTDVTEIIKLFRNHNKKSIRNLMKTMKIGYIKN